MTPLYDIISAWPVIGNGANRIRLQQAKLAMAVRSKNAHYKLVDIEVRHWHAVAQYSGVAGLFEAMQKMVENVDRAFATVEVELPAGFPDKIWHSIRNGTLQQKERFLHQLADVPHADASPQPR